MRDYFDIVTDMMGDGYSVTDAEMYAGNSTRPEPLEDDEEDQGCTCPIGSDDCTC